MSIAAFTTSAYLWLDHRNESTFTLDYKNRMAIIIIIILFSMLEAYKNTDDESSWIFIIYGIIVALNLSLADEQNVTTWKWLTIVPLIIAGAALLGIGGIILGDRYKYKYRQ
jgi:hypothetical protein